jgi:hypothetical protein
VPPEIGLLVMLKVLTYDAGFDARVGAREFLVLVPYAPGQADAARNLAAAGTELPIKTMVGRALRFEPVTAAELDTKLLANGASAILIPSGTPPELARTLAGSASRNNRYAITLDEALVKAGTTIGVALSAGKPQVILNIATARTIKAEFSPAVMRVARIQQ